MNPWHLSLFPACRWRAMIALVAGLVVIGAAVAPLTARAADKPLINADKPLNMEKPMPIKEVCLLLHGGYTNDEVLHEVTTRRLLEPVDAAAEKQLRDAGATPALINTLKTGNFNLSPADADAARARQAGIDQREKATHDAALARQQSETATAQNAKVQAAAARQPAQPQTQPASAPAVSPSFVPGMLHNRLVVFRNGGLQPYNDAPLANKKLFAFFFAGATGPDQKFTPVLVDFYANFVQAHPEFEVIFYSKDKTAADMQQYMQSSHMPWPALRYDKRADLPKMADFAVADGPVLLLVDGTGKVLSNSFRDGKYVGPGPVIQDLMAQVGTPVK